MLGRFEQLHARPVHADGESRDDHAPARPPLAADGEPARAKTREPAQLSTVDGFRGRDERAGAPRLDLDEDVAAAVSADEIDLAEPRPHVARNDAKPSPRELGLGGALAGDAESTAIHGKESGRDLL